jgi:lipopolysaccharide export LptBFGC system permease protein LptF
LLIRISEGMGAGGLLPPELAAWLPNMAFLALGMTLMARTRT